MTRPRPRRLTASTEIEDAEPTLLPRTKEYRPRHCSETRHYGEFNADVAHRRARVLMIQRLNQLRMEDS